MTAEDFEATLDAIDEATPDVSTDQTSEPAGPPIRQPSEFAGSDTAKTINEIVGGLAGDPELVRTAKIGESFCATLESAGGSSNVPAHYWLLGGLAFVAVVTFWRKSQAQGSAPAPTGAPPQ